MDCRQAGRAIEELYSDNRPLGDFPGLEEHLAQCASCQARYAHEGLVVRALGELETVPVSSDFISGVLAQLPDAPPEWDVAPVPRTASLADRLRDAWSSLLSNLGGSARQRRLVPALAVAAALILALALGYGLTGGGASSTPGAAVGVSPWLAGGLVLLVGSVLVVALFLVRRGK